MSFLFAANPADGDVVVQPQPDGSMIKGTYDSATNTWAVGELPQEPGIPGPAGPQGAQGDQGVPGRGLSVSGIVDTFEDLPSAPDHALQFWIVDDTNTVYFSDGVAWFDQGGPIRGPQGETGEDGTDGTDGVNGVNGKGWTGTTIIDETSDNPPNYQIRFDSDDGLGFVTENLVGPQGEVGEIPVASATRLGGIKIGRGLNILPDGTAQAGETFVDLETVPLSPEGRPTQLIKTYEPFYFDYLDLQGQQELELNVSSRDNWINLTKSIPMPAGANKAMVWWFNPNQLFPISQSEVYTNDVVVYRGYLTTKIICGSNAKFSGNQDNMFNVSRHNLTLNYNGGLAIVDRWSNINATKVDEIFFEQNVGSIDFTLRIDVNFLKGRVNAGNARLVFLPFVDASAETSALTFSERAALRPRDQSEPVLEPPGPLPPELFVQGQSLELKYLIDTTIKDIDTELQYSDWSEGVKAQLQTYKDELFAVRTLPGTYDELFNTANTTREAFAALTNFQFRFEA